MLFLKTSVRGIKPTTRPKAVNPLKRILGFIQQIRRQAAQRHTEVHQVALKDLEQAFLSLPPWRLRTRGTYRARTALRCVHHRDALSMDLGRFFMPRAHPDNVHGRHPRDQDCKCRMGRSCGVLYVVVCLALSLL